jgi:hypothetical protein
VWGDDGAFLGWLVSGASEQTSPQLNATASPIELIANGSVGAASANSEHVVAGRLSLVVPGTDGANASIGGYAYLVLDEGVKVSAFVPPGLEPAGAVTPKIPSLAAGAAQTKLRAALESYATALPRVLLYEQLSLLPAPGPALTRSVLQDNFHHVTLTAMNDVAGGSPLAGIVNLNTTSVHVWRSVFEAYNAVADVEPLTPDEIASAAAGVANGLATASAPGKAVSGPFVRVTDFGASALLARNLPRRLKAADFIVAIAPMLRVRSETFRIRAYGDAVDPLDSEIPIAVAYCEALVQRTAEPAASGAGRRFKILFFRWLGPEDV